MTLGWALPRVVLLVVVTVSIGSSSGLAAVSRNYSRGLHGTAAPDHRRHGRSGLKYAL